jgi:RND family efflux transporter MFP subunit
LQSINFAPGSNVNEGDLLFVIEPTLYEARAQQAEADLANAQAQFQAAESQLAITRAIFEKNAGSRTELVQRTQARDQARAAVDQARANVTAARLDLSYTHIYAPTRGRIDRNLVDIGNLVGAGQPTVLASIVRQDPIYTYFDASERDLLRYRALRRQGQTVAAEGERNKAYLGLVTEDGFPHVGEVDYVSNRVDPNTGTIEVRAIFSNPDGILLPGLFGRVRLPFTRGQALLVPDVAIGADQGGRYVLVVDDTDTVVQRRVKLGALVEQMRVVDDGIALGEWVVVNGLQRARPGTKVKPVRLPPGQTTASADGNHEQAPQQSGVGTTGKPTTQATP